jgi:two-component system KDP operon response regulator KdpE
MFQLRRKIEPEPSRPRYLVSEPWVGYRFNPHGVVS